jgi:hypothetical protein
MRHHVPPKGLFFQEPHGGTSQTTLFFIVTAVETSNSQEFGGMTLFLGYMGDTLSFVLLSSLSSLSPSLFTLPGI